MIFKLTPKPFLSICIPTYNRSGYLKACIESLVGQPEFNSTNVEIVISDNASTDDTQSVAMEFVKKYDSVLYFRNDENVRDKNFPLCLSRAHGIYRKLSNDTLVYTPNSLATFLKYVRANDQKRPSLFFYGDRFKRHSKSNYFTYGNADDFLKDASFLATGIATFGLWDDEISLLKNFYKNDSTCLWQISVLLEVLNAKRGPVHVCAQPLFSNMTYPHKKDMSYGIFNVFHTNLSSLLLPYSESMISEETIQKIMKDLLFGFFLDMMINFKVYPSKIKWDEREDLCASVTRAYENESYYSLFTLVFYVRLVMKRIGKAWYHRV